jgi:hypothetical protein
MIIKTSELIGKSLNWAVAECQFVCDEEWDGTLEGVDSVSDLKGEEYSPSINGKQGAIIMEEWKIATKFYKSEGLWEADVKGGFFSQSGATLLVAAMRCFVSSRLGNEVDIPEILM